MPGFLTPDALPDNTVCRVILLPDDEQWIAVINGLLQSLCDPDSWQKFGELTPEECANRAQEMIDEYTFNGECP